MDQKTADPHSVKINKLGNVHVTLRHVGATSVAVGKE
jgi:2'-5' RNA ligase